MSQGARKIARRAKAIFANKSFIKGFAIYLAPVFLLSTFFCEKESGQKEIVRAVTRGNKFSLHSLKFQASAADPEKFLYAHSAQFVLPCSQARILFI